MSSRKKRNGSRGRYPALVIAITVLLMVSGGVSRSGDSDEVQDAASGDITRVEETASSDITQVEETADASADRPLAIDRSSADDATAAQTTPEDTAAAVSVEDIPDWSGSAYVDVDGGVPDFSDEPRTAADAYVSYSELDYLGRAQTAIGCLGTETLNTGDRESIGQIKPVGWETVKYPDIISDRYVYNRCHLLMQAAAAGADEDTCNSYKNLITGTRYLNVDGMLPFENELLDYIKDTGNHVLYRVTPIYNGKELIARGVQMEAYSVEDGGVGVQFNVYCYNIQPGISIDYATGHTEAMDEPSDQMRAALENGATSVKEL